MEAVRDFIAVEDSGRGIAPAGPSGVAGVQGVDTALALLREAASTAAGDAALWDFREAADFAGTVEELSRVLEYLQLVAAGAVDRTRKQATAAPKANTAWTTGWRDDSTYGTAGPGDASGAVAADGETAWATGWRDDSGLRHRRTVATRLPVGSPWCRIRIGRCRGCRGCPSGGGRRVPEHHGVPAGAAADQRRRGPPPALPRRGSPAAAGIRRRTPCPRAREELGAAVAAGEVASRAATIITLALDRVRHACDAEAAARMEHALTRTAAENDPDFLVPCGPELDRRAGPGRRRALRRTPPPAPGRLHPQTPPRPPAPRDLRDRRTVRTPPHRHEHRHQPPHHPHRDTRGTGSTAGRRGLGARGAEACRRCRRRAGQ